MNILCLFRYLNTEYRSFSVHGNTAVLTAHQLLLETNIHPSCMCPFWSADVPHTHSDLKFASSRLDQLFFTSKPGLKHNNATTQHSTALSIAMLFEGLQFLSCAVWTEGIVVATSQDTTLLVRNKRTLIGSCLWAWLCSGRSRFSTWPFVSSAKLLFYMKQTMYGHGTSVQAGRQVGTRPE